ncbi:MAG: oligopeptide/dipeptide ABC transporter ATP-binding protein, partial [Nitrososphaerales archaeon]
IAEIGPEDQVLSSPRHPYSSALIGAIPTIDGDRSAARSIPGLPPDLVNPPTGCRFHPRCPLAFQRCREVQPPLVRITRETMAACHLLEEWRPG